MNAESKECSRCKVRNPLGEFHKRSVSADGLRNQCKSCVRESANKYLATPEGKEVRRRYLQSEEGRAVQRRGSLKYVERHPEKVCKWQRENAGKHAAICGKGGAINRVGKQCVPAWFDLDVTIPVYVEARRLTKATSVRYEVDHAVPLRGLAPDGMHVVSGLHCAANLQVITTKDNIAKRDHTWPDQWAYEPSELAA